MKIFRQKRKIQKGELRNVEVDLISLLFDDMKPANMRGAVVKSQDGKARYKAIATSAKFKSETIGTEGLLYVTVMEPGVVDLQGDHYTAEEVKKAAYRFAKSGMVGRSDVNHNNQPVPEFVVAESYILKNEDKDHFPDTKVGSWVAVLKCEDLQSELWQKVQKGAFNGVSIAGKADDIVTTSDNTALIAELKNQMENIRKAIGNDNTEATKKALDTIQGRINELEKADNDSANVELIKSLTSEIKELNMSLTKAISKSLKGEPGDDTAKDRELTIEGTKVVIKSTHKELYKSLANVDSGSSTNILSANTTHLFIDEVMGSDESDTLSDITVVPLLKDEKIDAGIIQDLVFTNSLDEAASAQNIGTKEISCPTGILTAELTLGRDTVEFYKDKLGEEAFGAWVESKIAKKTEKAVRKLIFMGDRNAAAGAYKALDGVIAQAKGAAGGSKVIELQSTDLVYWDERLEAALLAFTNDVLEEQENFVFYVSFKDLIRIKSEVARRETPAGDKFLLEGGKLYYGGIEVKGRFLPDGTIVAGLSKFIILGFRTDAEIKIEHHGSDWNYHWYIRVRPGITYVDGFVKIFEVV